jgi:hypothetical protein
MWSCSSVIAEKLVPQNGHNVKLDIQRSPPAEQHSTPAMRVYAHCDWVEVERLAAGSALALVIENDAR